MGNSKPTMPSRRAGTTNWQYVKRIPKQLLDRIDGYKFTVLIPPFSYPRELSINIPVRKVVEFSLGTSDYNTALERCQRSDIAMTALLKSISTGRIIITDTQINEYAKSVYRFYKERYVDSTGLPSDAKVETLKYATAGFITVTTMQQPTQPISPYSGVCVSTHGRQAKSNN